ncbi:hypothetical protein BCR43DRAFT_484936 [Syncephalastrum racemosum]|uniref:Uncharacterized protein n=1 Tax=Syncephalastrum racemosum TaxID=13706 RepID=A0A1X2HLI3_SYNRA|nr:hypothetical protein BCR43DRAFT_484936 [Syncephalastrum racemosum]
MLNSADGLGRRKNTGFVDAGRAPHEPARLSRDEVLASEYNEVCNRQTDSLPGLNDSTSARAQECMRTCSSAILSQPCFIAVSVCFL